MGFIGIGHGFLNKSQLFNAISSICLCYSDAFVLDANDHPILNYAQPPQGTALSQQQYAGEYLDMTGNKPIEKLTNIYGPGWFLVGQDSKIEWLSPTVSIPSIIVTFTGINKTNGPHQNYVSRSFPSENLIIHPYSDFAPEQTNREFLITTIILAGFSVVQGILYAIGKRKPKQSKIN